MEDQVATSQNTDTEDLFKLTGGVGRFQVLAFIVIVSGMISVSFWFFALGFFLQIPGYSCTDASGDTFSCTADQVCSNGDAVVTEW